MSELIDTTYVFIDLHAEGQQRIQTERGSDDTASGLLNTITFLMK